MSMHSFFDYPSGSESVSTQDLVFLRKWDQHHWQTLLKYTTMRTFRTGETVIRRGDEDRSFYIIIEGRLEVLIPRRGSKKLQSILVYETGSVIGEQAFIDGSPRSATVRALTDGEMLQMSVNDFEVFAAQHPDLARSVLFELARLLSVKLRNANAFISKWVK